MEIFRSLHIRTYLAVQALKDREAIVDRCMQVGLRDELLAPVEPPKTEGA